MKTDKITMEEMEALFGSKMPIEAANLLFNAPDGMTVGEVRAAVRKIAARGSDVKDILEALTRTEDFRGDGVGMSAHLVTKRLVNPDGKRAAAVIERLIAQVDAMTASLEAFEKARNDAESL